MAELCFPAIFVILVGMLLLGILRMKPEYLNETGELSVKGWLMGTYQVLCLFLPFVFLPVTLGNVRKPQETGRVIGGAAVLLTGIQILVLLLLQGSFGLGGYEHKAYPVVDFMSGIRIPGDFLERVDIFWLAAVMFSVLFSLGSVFFYNHELLARNPGESRNPINDFIFSVSIIHTHRKRKDSVFQRHAAAGQEKRT